MCQWSLYKTEKTRKSLGWNGNVEKKWASEIGETTGETTNKTHTNAREMMKIYYLEPDCVISTFEFIISSFRFVSNQSEYIRTIRLESRVE